MGCMPYRDTGLVAKASGSDQNEERRPVELDLNTITFLEDIGSGNFGVVYKAIINGNVSSGAPSRVVAAKVGALLT